MFEIVKDRWYSSVPQSLIIIEETIVATEKMLDKLFEYYDFVKKLLNSPDDETLGKIKDGC